MAAALQRGFHIKVRGLQAADGLHHGGDLRVAEDHVDVVDEQRRVRVGRKVRMSQMYFTVTGWPARRSMLAALRRSTSSTPLPTVP